MNTSNSQIPDVGAWYALYAARLRGVTRRIVGNDHDAEDATQDAFLAAFRARERYHANDPYPWLYRIATRKALTIAAAHRAVPADLERAAGLAVPSAEEEAIAHAEARRVRALVLSELPVALHVIEDLRFRDVGDRLGIPPATAATRIRRGKRRLRVLLQATTPRFTESIPA